MVQFLGESSAWEVEIELTVGAVEAEGVAILVTSVADESAVVVREQVAEDTRDGRGGGVDRGAARMWRREGSRMSWTCRPRRSRFFGRRSRRILRPLSPSPT